jgi:phosphoribosylanthranilate isomerase
MSAASDVSFVIKVCGITNDEDARVAINAGANALGFNFYDGSPRYVTVAQARQIVQAVGKPFLKVGVFVNATEAQLAEAVSQVPLDIVQLHGENRPAPLSDSYRIWRSISACGGFFSVSGHAEAYVLDTPSLHFGGSGKSFDWSLAAKFALRKIIAGGLDGTNVADAIRVTLPWGVDACSRLETSPRKKDAQRVREFVRAALAARSQEVAL